MSITKPAHGSTNWDTATNAVIDAVNALGGAATLNVGTTTGTVAAGDDSRITGAAQKASNLSDLASASTARTNLGLGGAAVLSVGTTAGTVAAGDDSRISGAVQKASNLSDLANAGTARTNLGLAAIAASGSAADLTTGTVATARLGAGSASNTTFLRGDQTWAIPAGGGGGSGDMLSTNNLSDVASIATSRQNLAGSSTNQSFGYQNQTALTTGLHNTSFGYQALNAVTSGWDNVGIGYQAQAGLTTGNSNVAVGSGTQPGPVTGDSNVAIGNNAQNSLTSGVANVAVGQNALLNVTSGGFNMAVGSDALRLNVTGNQNVAMGEGALFNVTNSQNLGVGPSAGRSLTTGSQNTAIGYNAGKDDGTTSTVATVSNTVMLGALAQALVSNVAVIGSTVAPMSLCLGNYGDQLGGGQGVFALSNATTNPSTNPSGGGVLYADAGALKWRGSSGTVTTLALA